MRAMQNIRQSLINIALLKVLKRLHSSIGYIPPIETEADDYNQLGKHAN